MERTNIVEIEQSEIAVPELNEIQESQLALVGGGSGDVCLQ